MLAVDLGDADFAGANLHDRYFLTGAARGRVASAETDPRVHCL